MEKREALEVHRETRKHQIIMKKHESFIKNTHNCRLR